MNSITRSVGQAAGSALAVALLTTGTDPVTGLPPASAFTPVCLIGAAAAAVVVLVALGALADGRRPTGEGPRRAERSRHGHAVNGTGPSGATRVENVVNRP